MRLLITNMQLCGRSGTELYVFDLALELVRQGERPIVYSPKLGELADQLKARAVPVVDQLDQIAEAPDLIHGNHLLPTLTALSHFPGTPAINVCHDCSAWHDRPVIHPRVKRHVAVDAACEQRLVEMEGVPSELVEIHFNGVDLQKFSPRAALPKQPSRALLLSNYADDRAVQIVHEACRQRQITLHAVGRKLGGTTDRPEKLLRQYDLVLAKGRIAWEALAVGCAVIVCDARLISEAVRSDNVAELRKWNFGRRTLQTELTERSLTSQLQRYDASDAAAVSQLIRGTTSLEITVAQLRELYGEVLESSSRQQFSADEESKALADHLHWLSQYQRKLASEVAERHSIPGTIKRWTRSVRRRTTLHRLATRPKAA
jgi:hypothetical protein